MYGRLLQLGRDGAGLIVEDPPQSRAYGMAKAMLDPDMPIDAFLHLEGRRVTFEIENGMVTQVRLTPKTQQAAAS